MTAHCPDCRTRRATFSTLLRHVAQTGHELCTCGGYHFAHRPGSPYCAYNPLSALRMADRYGATPEDLQRCARHIVAEAPEQAPHVRTLLKDWNIDGF